MPTITCAHCQVAKPSTEFYWKRDRATPRVLQPCKACRSAASKLTYRRRRPVVAPGHKRCPHCQQTKPLDAFGVNTARHDGRQVYCLECWPIVAKTYRYRVSAEIIEVAERQHKVCSRCHAMKRIEDFPRSKPNKGGRHAYCKACMNEYTKARRIRKRPPVPPEGFARCSACATTKPLDEFFRNRARPNGRTHYCKACFHTQSAARRAMKKYRKSAKGLATLRRYARAYQKAYRQRPGKARMAEARKLTTLAITFGVLVPQPCEVQPCAEPTQVHHTQYERPLEGLRWLCKAHHLSAGHGGHWKNPPM